MSHDEAKFILAACRPDGRDRSDPAFAAALAAVERDPELRRWFEAQQAFDRTVAAKLARIAPPPGLRETILTGAKLSAPRPRLRWRQPAWLGLAAALVCGGFLAARWALRPAAFDAPALAAAALGDLTAAHDRHEGFPVALAAVQQHLAQVPLPLGRHLRLDRTELAARRCRTVTLAGREMFEVCFERDGAWFHLYVGRRDAGSGPILDPHALLTARGELAATAWADAENIYALVTDAGAAALRRLI
jgi:hypothetical protein